MKSKVVKFRCTECTSKNLYELNEDELQFSQVGFDFYCHDCGRRIHIKIDIDHGFKIKVQSNLIKV